MKTNAINTGKFRKLVRRLREHFGNIPVATETVAVGLMERLWHVTTTAAPQGDIGKLDNEDIAELVGWHGNPDELVSILLETGWLDASDEHRLLIHDWHEHAPNHIKNNLKRWSKPFLTLNADNIPEANDDSTKEPPKQPAKDDASEAPRAGAVTKPIQVKPILSAAAVPHSAPTGSADWHSAAAAVRDCGVERDEVLVAATNAGVPLEEIHALIAHFRQHREAHGWGPQALHSRLKNAYPGQPVDRGWPKAEPPPKVRNERDEARKVAEHEAAERARREKREAEQRRRTELESQFGATLDAMDRPEVLSLAAEAGDACAKQVRKSGNTLSPSLRDMLLRQLAKRQARKDSA